MRVSPFPPSTPIYKWCEDDAGLGCPLRPWPDLPPTRSPIAQLARALAWHARGHRFDPDILHFAYNAHEIFEILTQARL